MAYDIRSISQVGTSEPFELQVARGQIPGHSHQHIIADVPEMSNNTLGTVWDVNDTPYPWSAWDTPGTLGVARENAADAEIYGLDIDATWAPTADFTLRAGLSALDSEYSDYTAIVQFSNAVLDGTIDTANPTPGAAGRETDVSGRSLLKAPELSYFVTVNYDFDLGSARMPASLTWSYKDDTIFDFGDDPVFGPYLTQDGYGLLSGRISYEPAGGQWSVGFWGRNLTDEEYLSEIAANAQGLRGAPADPRTFGVDARYSF
jgi:iron complex outermembrane receptor protein